jgi:transcription elongation factor Elf1
MPEARDPFTGSPLGVRPPNNPPCPKCESNAVSITLMVASGFYCRCNDCGHMWHFEIPQV